MAAVGEQTRGPLIARTRRGLILEFVALFIAAPVAIAVFVNPQYMFAVLSGFCLLAVFLIRLTGDYHWKSLVSGWGEVRWGRTAVFCVFVAVAAFLVMAATKPGFVPNVSPERLRFLALLWVLYPLLSALPQEVIFRVLFFHRYGSLFASDRAARLIYSQAGSTLTPRRLYARFAPAVRSRISTPGRGPRLRVRHYLRCGRQVRRFV